MNSETRPAPEPSIRPYFALWLGQAASLFGTQLVQFALIWWLTRETGSATVLATATLFGFIPAALLGPFAGALADRWNRQRVMLLSDSLVALVTAGLIALFATGRAEIWHVYLALLLRAAAGTFHFPAFSASTSLMVPERYLTRVQGVNQTLYGALNIASAPLGAVLMGLLPIQGVLAVDIVTALLAILPLLVIRVPQPTIRLEPDAPAAAVARPSFVADLRQGLRYAWGWPGLLAILLMSMILNLVLNPTFALLPLLVTQHFQLGALELGWLESSWGIGMVSGGILLGVWGGFRRRIVTSMAGLLVLGAAVLALGLTPAAPFTPAIGLLFVVGLANPIIDGPLFAILQATVAPEMQGRIIGLVMSGSKLMTPLGLALAGPAADAFGVRAFYIVAGIVVFATAVIAFFVPAVMNVEENDSQSASSPAREAAAGGQKFSEQIPG
jgi:DHA3 family macrolide efflux protein-like MFS transporter